MEILGYGLSLLIGISLGLVGGGGSILTVPVLVYIFQLNPLVSTSYSLFVVGSSSLVGSMSYFSKGLVNWRTALLFALPSLVSAYIARNYLVPSIPEMIIDSPGFSISRKMFIMVGFAITMFFAAMSMIRSKNKCKPQANEEHTKLSMLLLQGFLVGLLTGTVGAGGGFLIIPALVVFGNIPMRQAVGTSLAIISINSLVTFVGDHSNHKGIEWSFLLLFTAIAILGIFIGSFLSNKISDKKLKPSFGWFTLSVAIVIVILELFIKK